MQAQIFLGYYTNGIIVFFASLIVLQIFRGEVLKYLRKLFKKSENELDDLLIEIIEKIHWPFYIIISAFIAVKFIQAPLILNRVLYFVFLIGLTYYTVQAVSKLIDFAAERLWKQREEKELEIDKSALDVFKNIAKVAVWIVAGILLLQNFGYDVTALIAGLGIGGLAIGFALKNILGDIFASFSIYLDKPFKTGDFIAIGEDKGTVEHIGIKSTRIRTLGGYELIVSNEELTDSRISNFKNLQKRRVDFSFGVTYETPVEKVKKIPEMVKKIINEIDLAETSRVHFTEFGDSALVFSVVYYIDSPDYTKYMDIQEEINLKIMEKFEEEKIEMAYPTQTVYLKKSS